MYKVRLASSRKCAAIRGGSEYDNRVNPILVIFRDLFTLLYFFFHNQEKFNENVYILGCVPLKLAKKLSSTNCYPQSFSVLLYNFPILASFRYTNSVPRTKQKRVDEGRDWRCCVYLANAY